MAPSISSVISAKDAAAKDAMGVLCCCQIGNRSVSFAADMLRRGISPQQAGREIMVLQVQESGPEVHSMVLPGDGANANAEPKPAKSLAARMLEKFKGKG